MLALGVARDLGAYHPCGVRIVARAAHPADAVGIEAFDLKGAGARAVVRTGGMGDIERHVQV